MSNVKQVIIVRKDLKMRRGKEIAQGSHGSCMWFGDRWRKLGDRLMLNDPERAWLTGSFKKVVLQVNSEEELLTVYNKAKEKGLLSYLVTDPRWAAQMYVLGVIAVAIEMEQSGRMRISKKS